MMKKSGRDGQDFKFVLSFAAIMRIRDRAKSPGKELTRMSFGEKFKALREAKGMPRAAVDEALSLMRGTVSNWENGYREPEEELLPEIARFFGVKIRDLAGNAA